VQRTAAATLDLRPLRPVAGAMLAAGAVWNLLPAHPPITCPLRATTGVPCPFCGMTRAISAAVHGDLGRSLAYNPGGILLVVAAVVLLALPLAVPSWRDRLAAVRIPVPLILAAFGALWVWNVAFNPTF
jgi:hypothetical protein